MDRKRPRKATRAALVLNRDTYFAEPPAGDSGPDILREQLDPCEPACAAVDRERPVPGHYAKLSQQSSKVPSAKTSSRIHELS